LIPEPDQPTLDAGTTSTSSSKENSMSLLAAHPPRPAERAAVLAFLEVDRRLRRLEHVDPAASARLRLALADMRQRYERGAMTTADVQLETSRLLETSSR
jgi:hypothetical protein